MRAIEFLAEVKQRLDPKCWKGKHKEGTKIKGGVRVNNCVPNESVEEDIQSQTTKNARKVAKGVWRIARIGDDDGYEWLDRWDSEIGHAWNDYYEDTLGLGDLEFEDYLAQNVDPQILAQYAANVTSWVNDAKFDLSESTVDEAANAAQQAAIAIAKKKKAGINEELDLEFDMIETIVEHIAAKNNVDSEVVWEDLESLSDDELYVFAVTQEPVNEDWQKVNKKDKTDGMSKKAVNAYRREHPGSKLKTAVTTKPSKLKKGSKASKRRKSYCSRSKGQMKMHNISCAKTPDKAICKARRRWNC